MTDPTREQEDQGTPRLQCFNDNLEPDADGTWVRFWQADLAITKLERDLNASRSAGRREGLEEALEVLRKLACSYLPEDRGLVLSEELGIHVYSPAAHLRIQLAAIRALASAQPRAEDHDYAQYGEGSSEYEQPRAKAAEQEGCEWAEDSDGIWHTDCGNAFTYDSGTPEENSTKFCQYCGATCAFTHYRDEDAALPSLSAGQGERG